ncbi:MAG: putative quinol monooxygenase [Janthinobacterium lividum]
MASELFWVFTLQVNPGKYQEFKTLVSAIVAATSREPATLAYQYSVNADQSVVHIYERYQNSDAFVRHVEQTFGGFAERFLSLVVVSSLVVYGAPTAEARKALDTFNATYMTLFDGFSR